MRFSVALCTYNGAEYISEQIKSIISQTYSVDEIIICDDGSTDETLSIAEDILKSVSVEYEIIVNEKSLGVANNFLKALKRTTGDYVFTCDQDDIWTKDKVEIFAERIQKSQRLLYFSNGILADKLGASLGVLLWDTVGFKPDTSEKSYFNVILRHPVVTGAAMCVARDLIDKVQEIPEAFLHDEWFSVVAVAENSIEAIDKITFFYRQHGKNVLGASKYSFSQKVSIWKKNISILDNLRDKNLSRVSNIGSVVTFENHKRSVDRAKGFWKDMCNLNDKGFFKRLGVICKHLFNHNYSLFYTGCRGFLRDLIKLFVPSDKTSNDA